MASYSTVYVNNRKTFARRTQRRGIPAHHGWHFQTFYSFAVSQNSFTNERCSRPFLGKILFYRFDISANELNRADCLPDAGWIKRLKECGTG
jgi:hypothetical protein